MCERSVGLVNDDHEFTEAGVEKVVLQRLPVSPILFEIYLSGVFRKVGKDIKGYTATSFINDCRWFMFLD